MNGPKNNPEWSRLVAAARLASTEREAQAPYGFATRMAALAAAQPRAGMSSLLERFSLRALGVATLLALVSVAANYKAVSNVFRGDEGLSATTDSVIGDPVGDIVDIVS